MINYRSISCLSLVMVGVLGALRAVPADAATPFVSETADGSANQVGLFTSLALDAQGNPHVSYHDNTTSDLKYARKSGGIWTIEIADGSPFFSGAQISLALDTSGNPHVTWRGSIRSRGTRGTMEVPR